MEKHGTFLHPLLGDRRAGDREIRAKDQRVMPIVRAKEDQYAE